MRRRTALVLCAALPLPALAGRELHATLDSSALAEIAWRGPLDGGELTVRFRSGARYAYAGVPLAAYGALRTAPSAGRHFAGAIRDRYPHRRLP